MLRKMNQVIRYLRFCRARTWPWAAVSSCLALLFMAAVSAQPASANPSPPGQPGVSLGPTAITAVQMISETVTLTVASDICKESNGAPDIIWSGCMGARVVGDYLLRNPGRQTIELTVGFPRVIPTSDLGPPSPDYFDPLRNLKTFVDGVEIATYELAVNGETWDAWEMSFPEGDVHIHITYDMPVTLLGGPMVMLGYQLDTGAAWAGAIETGDVIVRFPYSAEELFLDLNHTQAGYQISGNEVRWHFENLEPTLSDNIRIGFAVPEYWEVVLQARHAVAADPTAENYLTLADAYDYFFRYADSFGWSGPIAQAEIEALLRAIEQDPDNKDIRLQLEMAVMRFSDILPPESGFIILTQVASTPLSHVISAISPTATTFIATKTPTLTALPSTNASATPTPISSLMPSIPISLLHDGFRDQLWLVGGGWVLALGIAISVVAWLLARKRGR